jgi:hypothetical protein
MKAAVCFLPYLWFKQSLDMMGVVRFGQLYRQRLTTLTLQGSDNVDNRHKLQCAINTNFAGTLKLLLTSMHPSIGPLHSIGWPATPCTVCHRGKLIEV